MASERDESQYIEQLETLLYRCVKELDYVHSVENCHSGLCKSAEGAELITLGMATLGVDDLSAESWSEVSR